MRLQLMHQNLYHIIPPKQGLRHADSQLVLGFPVYHIIPPKQGLRRFRNLIQFLESSIISYHQNKD